jgi:hypothetical protein
VTRHSRRYISEYPRKYSNTYFRAFDVYKTIYTDSVVVRWIQHTFSFMWPGIIIIFNDMTRHFGTGALICLNCTLADI